VHTPDSSRYWIAASYEDRQSQGMEPENIDKVLRSALRCYWMLFSESQYFPYPSFFNCLR
jgi:phosphoribosylaminoimidazole-succinocarboxamide synthase